MSEDHLRLPPTKEQAAQLIAKGTSQAETARQVGVATQTMWVLCHDPDFLDRVNFLRSDVNKQADEIIELGVIDAAKTVVGVANGSIGPTYDEAGKADTQGLNARLRAALYILDSKRKGLSSAKTDRSAVLSDSLDDAEADKYIVPSKKR